MSVFFTPHARARALERYGLDLSAADMSGIVAACNDGEAPVLRRNENGTTHAWKIGKQPVYPVVHKGVIVTFMPPDFFLASTSREHRAKATRAHSRTGRMAHA